MDLQKVNQTLTRAEKFSQGVSTSAPANTIDESMRYLGIDITFQDSSAQQMVDVETAEGGITRVNLGIQCISYIQKLCMEFQDLKPIVIVLKKLLQNSNLNSPYHGGLSSYSLVLMASTFLYTNNAFSMGKNLVEFLNYYGNYFNPQVTGCSGEDYILTLGNTDPIIVLDPLNPNNNTTRNAFRIGEIQQLFKKAHALILRKMKEFKDDK
jgi:hypothetical protein